MKKRFICIILVLIMTSGLLPTVTYAATSGSCGDNLTWSFDKKTGTLTVSGTGNMTEYEKDYDYPWYTFRYDIKTLIITEGVTSVGKFAFHCLSELENLTLPNSLKSIGYWSFGLVNDVTTLTIPAGITEIGEGAFANARFERIDITDFEAWCKIDFKGYAASPVRYNTDVYLNGQLLTDIVIPESISKIRDYTFNNFTHLKTVQFPNTLTSIGKYSFYECVSLTEINLPDSLKTIGDCAFDYCHFITSVKIPDGVTEIGNGAFSVCYRLKSITLPDSIKSIGNSAFSGCTSLVRLAIPNGVSKINDSTFKSGGIRVLYIPKSVTVIEDYAFYLSEIAHVYYGGSESDRQKIQDLDKSGFLNDAKWIYNATGLPDHVYTDENDKTCNLCEKKTIINSSRYFVDIKENTWYKKYVDYVYSYGIFEGNWYREFLPNDKINRAEFVQVLANLSGVDTSEQDITTKFTDVHPSYWCVPAIKWASDNKIVNGFGNGKFKPYEPVTREQMCVMLLNYAKFRGITLEKIEDKVTFADDAKISKWAKKAVYTCQTADIVNGKGKNTFDPQGTGTRAEASVIFTKFHKDYLSE